MTQAEPRKSYRVLARKYRPQQFSEVIGQDALIRTLRNAIESGRIAHAFMLTGVRGTGKTTTARLIAKALNYAGPDGTSGPTAGSTADCETCKAIAEDRHPDVMEMDAASRTGVDDIRDILDGVRYAPTSARYKVYIIDEVHMLSKNAFNALLKTLEEPPEHVIFIFATTEIRKVPVTVLSRCQRFDLRRVDAPTLAGYYKEICAKENVKAEDDALALIGRAADGSVRDGLSLLDRAIVLCGDNITSEQVRDMLGLADRTRVMDLLEHTLKGETAEALGIMEDLYRNGADPLVLLQDLLDLVHMLTRFKAAPKQDGADSLMTADALARAQDLAGKLSMPTLGRAWQILLKGIGEVAHAEKNQAAAEMVLIRLGYAADLPDPGELLKKLRENEGRQPSANDRAASAGGGEPARALEPVSFQQSAPVPANATRAALAPQPQSMAPHSPRTVEALELMLRTAGFVRLAGEVYQYMHPVRIDERLLEFRPGEMAPQEMASNLIGALREITGERWVVTVSTKAGGLTMAETRRAAEEAMKAEARQHPAVAQILEAFPNAELTIEQN